MEDASMSGLWTQFRVLWELVGELETWRQSEAPFAYTYDYCDECGEEHCVRPECHAVRIGFFGDLDEYIREWRDPYCQDPLWFQESA